MAKTTKLSLDIEQRATNSAPKIGKRAECGNAGRTRESGGAGDSEPPQESADQKGQHVPAVNSSLPGLLSAAEVAELFQRTTRSLFNWECRGLLIPLRIGRSKYYRLSDVERLINGEGGE